MDVFGLGFFFIFFYIYGCRLGFWYEILAKGLLSISFIFAYFSLLLLYVLCFVKFCESARIEVFDDRSTTEIKTGAMFLLLGASRIVVLVIAGILLYR